MSEIDDGKMSFFDHLTELRTRIVWSLIPSAVGLGVALYFTTPMMKFIQRPLTKMDMKLVFTTPTEAFWTYMKVAMIAGLFIAMPVVLWNVWAFVAPGLHKHERKYAAPFVIIGSVLFLLGGAFALLVIVPYASTFLVTFGQDQGLGKVERAELDGAQETPPLSAGGPATPAVSVSGTSTGFRVRRPKRRAEMIPSSYRMHSGPAMSA